MLLKIRFFFGDKYFHGRIMSSLADMPLVLRGGRCMCKWVKKWDYRVRMFGV